MTTATQVRPNSAKIRARIGTREESLPFVSAIECGNYHSAKDDARCVSLPDGHREAVRVRFDCDTGHALKTRSGNISICAPWLLS
jgi:hypothetical protein